MSDICMRRLGACLVSTVICVSSVEAGLVYRCDTANETVIFSDLPCEQGNQRSFDQQAAPAPGTRLVDPRHLPKPRRAKQVPRRSSRGDATRSSSSASEWCRNKRRQLENVQDELRAGYSPSRGEKLRKRRRQIEADLRERCR